MVTSTVRVRFQGLGEDIDEKAKRGQERRKQRKWKRQQQKMAQEENFQRARAFLEWLKQQRRVAAGDDDDDAIFRERNTRAAASTVFAETIALAEGQLAITRAREYGYSQHEGDELIAQTLLENNCDSWKSDSGFVYLLLAWASKATKGGYYLTYSYSSSSSEGGTRVVVDSSRLVNMARSLGYCSDTFLTSTEVLKEVRRLVASRESDRIDATTTALIKGLLGENFQSGGTQDADGAQALQAAITQTIQSRSPSAHRVHLEATATWLVNGDITPEERGYVYDGVFGPEEDHVSSVGSSEGMAAASEAAAGTATAGPVGGAAAAVSKELGTQQGQEAERTKEEEEPGA